VDDYSVGSKRGGRSKKKTYNSNHLHVAALQSALERVRLLLLDILGVLGGIDDLLLSISVVPILGLGFFRSSSHFGGRGDRRKLAANEGFLEGFRGRWREEKRREKREEKRKQNERKFRRESATRDRG
jgi:hypothetical protein